MRLRHLHHSSGLAKNAKKLFKICFPNQENSDTINYLFLLHEATVRTHCWVHHQGSR